MNLDRQFELSCDTRGENTLPCTEFYISPNQFDGDLAFAPGVDEMFADEGDARDVAYGLARHTMKPVFISIFRDGKATDEDITVAVKSVLTLA